MFLFRVWIVDIIIWMFATIATMNEWKREKKEKRTKVGANEMNPWFLLLCDSDRAESREWFIIIISSFNIYSHSFDIYIPFNWFSIQNIQIFAIFLGKNI